MCFGGEHRGEGRQHLPDQPNALPRTVAAHVGLLGGLASPGELHAVGRIGQEEIDRGLAQDVLQDVAAIAEVDRDPAVRVVGRHPTPTLTGSKTSAKSSTENTL